MGHWGLWGILTIHSLFFKAFLVALITLPTSVSLKHKVSLHELIIITELMVQDYNTDIN